MGTGLSMARGGCARNPVLVMDCFLYDVGATTKSMREVWGEFHVPDEVMIL